MRKFKLIYNSIAGQSRFKNYLDSVIEKFTLNNCEISIFRASRKADLKGFLLSSKEEYNGIIIAGGDGTINRVVNCMIKNNIDLPVGILPAGTSNDFARHLKLPKDYMQCVDVIINGNIIPIDIGYVNGNYFVNVCSAGMFTNTSQKVDINLKNTFGHMAYIATALAQMIRFKAFNMQIETRDKIIIEKVFLFLVFNGSSAGGLDKFACESSVRDGLLDIIAIKQCNILEAAKLLTKILKGEHLDDSNVIYLKENWIRITKLDGECDEPDVDGEEGPVFPLDIKCINNGLRIFHMYE